MTVSRPLTIKVICVLGGLAVIVAGVEVASHWNDMLAESRAGTVAAISGLLLTAISLYGMWRMKRWGVAVLALALLGRVVYGLIGGPPLSPLRLIGPGVILLFGAFHLPRMD